MITNKDVGRRVDSIAFKSRYLVGSNLLWVNVHGIQEGCFETNDTWVFISGGW